VPAIQIRGLAKRYKTGVLANDAIDLDIPPGIIFGLLGPNGAGKTTLVRQLTADLAPTAGTIHILDIDVLRDAHGRQGPHGHRPLWFLPVAVLTAVSLSGAALVIGHLVPDLGGGQHPRHKEWRELRKKAVL